MLCPPLPPRARCTSPCVTRSSCMIFLGVLWTVNAQTTPRHGGRLQRRQDPPQRKRRPAVQLAHAALPDAAGGKLRILGTIARAGSGALDVCATFSFVQRLRVRGKEHARGRVRVLGVTVALPLANNPYGSAAMLSDCENNFHRIVFG